MTSDPPDRRMLTSWKEIARFFDRDARTVQRWEKEGLPVHRHRHRRQSSVYAYVDELDAWWQERGAVLSGPALFGTPEVPPASDGKAAAAGDANRGQMPGVTARQAGWIFRLTPVRLTAIAVAITAGALVVLGIVMAIPPGRSPAPAHVVATLDGSPADGALIDTAVSDFNGDGRNDLVVASQETREIHVLFGGSIPAAGHLALAAGVTIRGTENGNYHARAVADLDGDGLRDLLVSVILKEPDGFRATGATYLLRGRRTWQRRLQLPEAADVTFRYMQPKDIRMWACLSMEPTDLNGDGIHDLVLGGGDFSPPGRASAGGIFVLFGRRGWPAVIDVERDADFTIHGSRAGEALGSGCDVGDINGDGRTDLVVLAGEHTLWNMLGGRGRYYVFLGRDRWPQLLTADRDADVRIDGERPGDAGHPPVLADLNGDGFDDLVVGSTAVAGKPGIGRLTVFFGAPATTGVRATIAADVSIDSDSLAPAAFSADDLDGDGMGDLILAEAGPGRVHVLFGRSQWPARGRLADLGVLELFSREPGLGRALLRLGDLDGNGLAEIMVSSAVGGSGQAGAERLWLLTPHRPVKLDVRPGLEPNVLFLPGVLVAMVAGESLTPVDPIEPDSVRLAGVAPTRTEWRDFDRNGSLDLLAYFETRDMRVTPGTTRVSLTARTRGGHLVAGHDSVTVMTGTADQLSQPGQTDEARALTRR